MAKSVVAEQQHYHKHLDRHLRKNGYVTEDADACLYVKYDKLGTIEIAIATEHILFISSAATLFQRSRSAPVPLGYLQ